MSFKNLPKLFPLTGQANEVCIIFNNNSGDAAIMPGSSKNNGIDFSALSWSRWFFWKMMIFNLRQDFSLLKRWKMIFQTIVTSSSNPPPFQKYLLYWLEYPRIIKKERGTFMAESKPTFYITTPIYYLSESYILGIHTRQLLRCRSTFGRQWVTMFSSLPERMNTD